MPQELIGRPATWEDLARHEARKAKIPPALALAVMGQESSGDPTQVSPQGAQGLFQLMPETAKGLGVDPADPLQNIRGGVTYLRQQLDATGGDVAAALARYHAGPDLAQHGPKTATYVQEVLGRLQGAGSAPISRGGAPVSQIVARGVPGVGMPPPPPSPAQFEPTEVPAPGTVEAYLAQRAEVGQPPGLLASMAGGFDPRTPAGRLNWAAAAGATIGAVATRSTAGAGAGATLAARMIGAAPRLLAPVVGAGAGGALAEAGEQVVGTAPPSPEAVVRAGVQQAGYETLGGLFGAGVRRVRRMRATRPIGQAASKALTTVEQATAHELEAALKAVPPLAKQARAMAGRGMAEPLVGQPPASPAVGRAISAVREGPAQTARDLAGRAVEEAAEDEAEPEGE
mgnify:FL=1